MIIYNNIGTYSKVKGIGLLFFFFVAPYIRQIEGSMPEGRTSGFFFKGSDRIELDLKSERKQMKNKK